MTVPQSVVSVGVQKSPNLTLNLDPAFDKILVHGLKFLRTTLLGQDALQEGLTPICVYVEVAVNFEIYLAPAFQFSSQISAFGNTHVLRDNTLLRQLLHQVVGVLPLVFGMNHSFFKL